MASCEIRILTEDDWAMWRAVRLRSLVDAPDSFGSKLADWQGANDREDRWRTRFDNVAFNAVALVDGSVVGTVGAMHHSQGALYVRAGFVLVGPNPDDGTEDLMARELDVSRRGGT